MAVEPRRTFRSIEGVETVVQAKASAPQRSNAQHGCVWVVQEQLYFFFAMYTAENVISIALRASGERPSVARFPWFIHHHNNEFWSRVREKVNVSLKLRRQKDLNR